MLLLQSKRFKVTGNESISSGFRIKQRMQLRFLKRFLKYVVGAYAQHMVLKSLCAEGRQNYKERLFQLNLRQPSLRICVELSDLLNHLNSIFHWHLKVKQHQSYWLCNAFKIVIQRARDYLFGLIDSFLSVHTKSALLDQANFSHLVPQHLNIYEHVISNQNLLHMTES